LPVRVDAEYGKAALATLEAAAQRIHVAGELEGNNLCAELDDEQLLDTARWETARFKPSVQRFAEGQRAAGGQAAATVLVPVVHSRSARCTRDGLPASALSAVLRNTRSGPSERSAGTSDQAARATSPSTRPSST